jgi:hypothetical protein
LRSHVRIPSVTPRQVALKVTVATDVMKTSIPVLLHPVGIPIHEHYPLSRRLAPESTAVVGCVSAHRTVSWSFIDRFFGILQPWTCSRRPIWSSCLLRMGYSPTVGSKSNFRCRSCGSSNKNDVPCHFTFVMDGSGQKEQVKV